MAILYPLIIPGSIGPIEANLKKIEAVGEFIGPFDGSAQQQAWQDQHWDLDLVWPEMNWAQFAALDAFAGAMHGKWGSFLWGPPLAAAPRGSGGTPATAGTNNPSRSNLLNTTGWTASASGLLLPGDFFHLFTIPANIAIASIQVAGAYLYVTLQAAPPAGLLIPYVINPINPTIVNFRGVTNYSVLNSLTAFLYNLSGAVLQFNIGASGYGPAADTGYIVFPGSPTPLQRLHQYVGGGALASDGSGAATLDIWPSIREAPPAGTLVTLANPSGLFRLADNRREAPARRNKTFTFQMKCREAI